MSCLRGGQNHDCPGTLQLLLGFSLHKIEIALAGAWFWGQLGYFSEGPQFGVAWPTEAHGKGPSGLSCPSSQTLRTALLDGCAHLTLYLFFKSSSEGILWI